MAETGTNSSTGLSSLCQPAGAVVAKVVRSARVVEISLKPPQRWLPLLSSGVYNFDALVELQTGERIYVSMRLHRITPSGRTYTFYVHKPASAALAAAEYVKILELTPRAERQK